MMHCSTIDYQLWRSLIIKKWIMRAQLFKHIAWKISVQISQAMNFKSCKDFLHEKSLCRKIYHSPPDLKNINFHIGKTFYTRNTVFSQHNWRYSQRNMLIITSSKHDKNNPGHMPTLRSELSGTMKSLQNSHSFCTPPHPEPFNSLTP